MPKTPILHFSGRFTFEYPEYNNAPTNVAIPFDSAKPTNDVMQATAGDPAKYFEFAFKDVVVQSVTYGDGTTAIGGDAIIGERLQCIGYLVDVAPSAIVATLHAGRMKLGTVLSGKVATTYMSSLKPTILKTLRGGAMEMLGAHFEAAIDAGAVANVTGSRWREELGAGQSFVLRFSTNRFCVPGSGTYSAADDKHGDIYGQLLPAGGAQTFGDVRLVGRRLLRHLQSSENPRLDLLFGDDPEGSYDLIPDAGLVLLHYPEFIRFLGTNHETSSEVREYAVRTIAGGENHVLATFRGDHAEMLVCGGALAIPAAESLSGLMDGSGKLVVSARMTDGSEHLVMQESEWDLTLKGPRGITLASAESRSVEVRVYRNNRPVPAHEVRFEVQDGNPRSPIVASFERPVAVTDADGRCAVALIAADLTNLASIADPVTGGTLTRLPLDRYAGHYANVSIDNTLRQDGAEVREIALRVLHRYGGEPGSLSVPNPPLFDRDLLPVLTYLDRYFPWLHVRHDGAAYRRFLDLVSYDDVAARAPAMRARLLLDATEPRHMPRSRDLPFGFAALFATWIEAGMPR